MKTTPSSPRDIQQRNRLAPGPFENTIVIGWGDCDPARIAYAARIPDYGLRTIEAWFKACLGVGYYELNVDCGVGTPFVHLACDFHAPVTAREPLHMQLTLSRVGRSSLHIVVKGVQNGRLCVQARFVCVFIDAATHTTIAIAPNMRASLVAFAAQQGCTFENHVTD